MTVQHDLLSVCRDHLQSQSNTLWGRAWDITQPAGLEGAAQWLKEEYEAVAQNHSRLIRQAIEESNGVSLNGPDTD